MSTIEMPKTYREQLDEIEIGENILINQDKRRVWANSITAMHNSSKKQFTIRTRDNETRVWRLKDLEVDNA